MINIFSVLSIFWITFLNLHSARAAQIGVYLVNVSDVTITNKCQDLDVVITAFSNLCTASYFGGVKLTSCTDSLIKGSLWTSSTTSPTCSGKPTGSPAAILNATKDCSFWYGSPGSPFGYYTKILDSTCVPQNLANVFITSSTLDFGKPLCRADDIKEFSTIIADGNCYKGMIRSLHEIQYKASVSTTGDVTVSTYFPLDSQCQDSALDNRWSAMSPNGKCFSVIIGNGKDDPDNYTLAITKPVADDFSGLLALAAAIVITISIISTCIFCCALWGILHCLGCVNCPCFNFICDRRKNSSSKSSSYVPSYPIAIPSSTIQGVPQQQPKPQVYAPQPQPQVYAPQPQPQPQVYAPQPQMQYAPQPQVQYAPQSQPQMYAPQPQMQYTPQPSQVQYPPQYGRP
jgi:hypothetical protein